MVMKTTQQIRQEFLDFCIKKRKCGNTYNSIRNYLKLNCDDESMAEEIVLEIERMEKNKELTVQRTFPVTNEQELKDSEVKGFILIIMGILLLSLLWDTTSQPLFFVKMIAMGVAFLIGMYD